MFLAFKRENRQDSLWGGGSWDCLHFLTRRSKSNDPPGCNHGKHERLNRMRMIRLVAITENMTIKCRTTGFGLKRLGDGVDHVCMRSMVGSLLLLLTLTHRRQGGCAGRLPCGGGGRAEARGGGEGGGITGFPPGDAPHDEEVAMLRRSS